MTHTPVSLEALLARLSAEPDTLPGTDPTVSHEDADRALAVLAEIAPAVAPPEDMFSRITGALDHEAAQSIVTRRADEGDWREVAPGVWMKTLSRGAQTGRMFLLRCEPGSVIPGHRHDNEEHVFVLAGEFEMAGTTVRAGDAQYAPGGTDHPDLHTRDGCLLLLYG